MIFWKARSQDKFGVAGTGGQFPAGVMVGNDGKLYRKTACAGAHNGGILLSFTPE